VHGDIDARIFCYSLEAEMISVAGRYRMAEDLRAESCWGKSVQVCLQNDVLCMLML
jgi:septum site-determining protein MinC